MLSPTPSGRTFPEIKSVAADLAETGLEPGQYDAVVSVSAIEHNPWEHQVRIFKHLLRLVPCRGVVIVTVPVGRASGWFPTGSFPNRPTWPPVHLYDNALLARLRTAIRGIGSLVEPAPLRQAGWADRWDKEHARMMAGGPEGHRMPYLSGGFVLRRS